MKNKIVFLLCILVLLFTGCSDKEGMDQNSKLDKQVVAEKKQADEQEINENKEEVKENKENLQKNNSECTLLPKSRINDGKIKWGYVDAKNYDKFVIEPIYDRAELFDKEGIAVVYLNDKAAIINKEGKLLIDFDKYNSIETFNLPYVIAISFSEEGSKRDLLSINGKVVEFFKLKENFLYFDKEYGVFIREEYGDSFEYLDLKENRTIYINSSYEKWKEDITKINNIDVLEKKDKDGYDYRLYGIRDNDNKIVLRSEYGYIEKIADNFFSVMKYDENFYGQESMFFDFSKKALFNIKGEQITDFKYYDIKQIDQNIFWVYEEKQGYFIDGNGKIIEEYPKLNYNYLVSKDKDILIFTSENYDRNSDFIYYNTEGKFIGEQNIYSVSDNCKIFSKKNSEYYGYSTIYPEIELKDKKIQEKINLGIKQNFIFPYSEENLNEETDEEIEESWLSESSQTDFEVKKFNSILQIQKGNSWYSIGAAHGLYDVEYLLFDINTGENINANSLFNDEKNWRKKVSELVRDKYKDTDYFVFDAEGKNDIELAKLFERDDYNIFFDRNKIMIYYDLYELTPYSDGIPCFEIKIKEIEDYLNKESELYKNILMEDK